jgi:hypothetical protein
MGPISYVTRRLVSIIPPHHIVWRWPSPRRCRHTVGYWTHLAGPLAVCSCPPSHRSLPLGSMLGPTESASATGDHR